VPFDFEELREAVHSNSGAVNATAYVPRS